MVQEVCKREMINKSGEALNKVWEKEMCEFHKRFKQQRGYSPKSGDSPMLGQALLSSNFSSMGSIYDNMVDVPPLPPAENVLTCLIAEDSNSVKKMLKKTVNSAGFR
jgi:hypothetical protein